MAAWNDLVKMVQRKDSALVDSSNVGRKHRIARSLRTGNSGA